MTAMLVHVALLVLLATLVATGNIVFPGPTAQPAWRSSQSALTAVTPQQMVKSSRIVPVSSTCRTTTPRCPNDPPEGTTEDTLDRTCFEMTDEEDSIAMYSALGHQCRDGFLLARDDSCRRIARLQNRKPPKKQLVFPG